MLLSSEEWEAVWLTLSVAARAVGFGLPVAVLAAWVLARCRFPGRATIERVGASTDGAAAGGHRVAAADPLRHPRTDRPDPGSLARRPPRVHHGWREPGLCHNDLPHHGAVGAAVARRRRCRSGTGRSHPWRGMAGPVVQHHTAARLAWNSGGRDRRLCDVSRRIRCRDNIRCQHPWSNPDLAAGDLRRASGAGWRDQGRRNCRLSR